ncbi:hypothetical protein KR018_011539 [Drosophila ironensis]|nr:hypothetical protein KR018_011539 [Drosophila ironensis]
MPLDQVYIALLRNRNWIRVVLLRSVNLFQPETTSSYPSEMVEVKSNGITWFEKHLEYRIELSRFFKIAVKTEEGEPIFAIAETVDNNVRFGLALNDINHRELVCDVDLGALRIHIQPTTTFSLHCSNCSCEVMPRRKFRHVLPVPATTMRPQNYFCGRKGSVYPREDQLFYGLNHLVVCPQVIVPKFKYRRGHRRLQCPRCLQDLGEILGYNVAAQLNADTLRLLQWDGESASHFSDIFGHVTATQMMVRLLHDADPVNMMKARIFLKAVRPDGQLHYLQLLVDTHQLKILRSELIPESTWPSSSEEGATESSSESDFCLMSSDSSDDSPQHADNLRPPLPIRAPPPRPPKLVTYVGVRRYRACRIKYLVSASDSELATNHDMFMLWRREGTRMLRISYTMMAELIGELNANEHMAAALEELPTPRNSKLPRLSYIILEPDDEFYNRQQQYSNAI